MWLPEPIYKSLPTLYAVMGISFVLGVIYLGLDTPMSPVYLGVGLVSLLAAVVVTIWRNKQSGEANNTDSDDAPSS